MALNLYDVTITPYIQGLKNLTAFLKKGEEWANENGVSHETLIETRLAKDMAALAFQVQRVSDTSKGVAVRVGGVAPVPMADNEKTFADLYERIQKTIDVLESVDRAAFNGKEQTEIVVPSSKGEKRDTALGYITKMATPNFYFHSMAAYAILRHAGVPVGKYDFIAPW